MGLIVVGIPALNEERAIARVIIRAQPFADKLLVIDDGSQDYTGLIAERLGAAVRRHNKTLGYGAAIRDCFIWAKQTSADVLITMDADGQHDPANIPALLDSLRNNKADIVIGSRHSRPLGMPRWRWVGKNLLDMATRVKVGERIVDAQSGFRAYSRRAIEELTPSELGMGADSELLMRAQRAEMKIVEEPITMGYIGLDASTHHPIMHWLDVLASIVKFISIRHPLLFYSALALACFIIALLFGVMTIDYYQQWGRVVTNLALVSIAAGLMGTLSLFTGIILFTIITVIRERNT